MNDKKKRGIGLTFALNGIYEAWKRERNFRIHVVIAFLVILSGFLFHLTLFEWLAILFAISIVLITELLNSITERVIDYLKPEYHPEAKIIKDIAAAVVLIAAIMSIIIGCIIFIPKIFY